MKKKILVTGEHGFIGKNVLHYLIDQYYEAGPNQTLEEFCRENNKYEVTGFSSGENNCRVDNVEDVKRRMEEIKPDVIVHLAAIPVIKPDDKNPSQILKTNIEGTFNLVHYAPKGCKFIFASTITVYGDSDGFSKFTENHVCSPTSIYASTKLAAENIINVYTKQGHIDGYSLRICANVGPYATHGIVPDFIKKVKSDSPTLDCLGDWPGSSKPFIHVEDTCKAILHLIENTHDIKTYNLCANDIINVENIAKIVMDVMKIHKPINFLGSGANWKGDNRLIKASNQLANNYLQWKPSHSSTGAIYKAVKELCNVDSSSDS